MAGESDRVLVVIGRTRHKMVVAELGEAVKRGGKFIELRLDFLAKAGEFKRLTPDKQCPWVATLRRPADGGRFRGGQPARDLVRESRAGEHGDGGGGLHGGRDLVKQRARPLLDALGAQHEGAIGLRGLGQHAPDILRGRDDEGDGRGCEVA